MRTRSEVAGSSARLCAIWANASQRRFRRVGDLEPSRGRSVSPDDEDELMGEVFLGVVALEEAFYWARLLVANLDGALEVLKAQIPTGDTFGQADLDAEWLGTKARRNAILHLEGEMRANPSGAIGLAKGRLQISGYPPMHLISGRLWSVALAGWAETILSRPIAEDRRPAQRPPLVDDSGPEWLRRGNRRG